MKLPNELCWKQVQEYLQRQGIALQLDLNPSLSGSGYVNGIQFFLTVCTDCKTAKLEIAKIGIINDISKEPLVCAISELIMGMPPFCKYENRNRAGFLIVEWRISIMQSTCYEEITSRRDVFNVIPLGL